MRQKLLMRNTYPMPKRLRRQLKHRLSRFFRWAAEVRAR